MGIGPAGKDGEFAFFFPLGVVGRIMFPRVQFCFLNAVFQIVGQVAVRGVRVVPLDDGTLDGVGGIHHLFKGGTERVTTFRRNGIDIHVTPAGIDFHAHAEGIVQFELLKRVCLVCQRRFIHPVVGEDVVIQPDIKCFRRDRQSGGAAVGEEAMAVIVAAEDFDPFRKSQFPRGAFGDFDDVLPDRLPLRKRTGVAVQNDLCKLEGGVPAHIGQLEYEPPFGEVKRAGHG